MGSHCEKRIHTAGVTAKHTGSKVTPTFPPCFLIATCLAAIGVCEKKTRLGDKSNGMHSRLLRQSKRHPFNPSQTFYFVFVVVIVLGVFLPLLQRLPPDVHAREFHHKRYPPPTLISL
mmetsp:Transcript_7361/g.14386  ORF Transcript_7361/g.14386 Transcript_7361/m.14386 type:complete len:118 (-) Transcript_7361:406-759(-)